MLRTRKILVLLVFLFVFLTYTNNWVEIKIKEIRGNTTTEHETKNTFSELKQGVGDLSKENKQQVRDTFFYLL
jgi:Tfp pilus assembly protein PilO